MPTSKQLALLFTIVFLSSCAGNKKKSEPQPTVSSTPAPTATETAQTSHPPHHLTPAAPTAPDPQPPHAMTTDTTESQHSTLPTPAATATTPTAAPQADHHHKVPTGVAPDKALGWLKNGNLRFRKGHVRVDGAKASDIKRLASGQKPHSIVLSCSDSRVPPEVVFDQKLGEIFVIRTAGETLDSMAIASMEYAVEHLGTRLLVVMGHTQCGAVKAAIDTFGGKNAGSPHLNKLVADIHPRLNAFQRTPASQHLEKESLANAQGVVSDLLARSEIIRRKVEAGEVKIQSALYHLDSGEVEF